MTEVFRFNEPRWNGIPCEAQYVEIIVGDSGQFPRPWYRDIIGEERAAIRVRTAPEHGEAGPGQTNAKAEFFLDDQDGSAYRKLMNGGGPSSGHRTLVPERIIDEGVKLSGSL